MVWLRLEVPQWVADEIKRMADENHRPPKWEAEWLLTEAVRPNNASGELDQTEEDAWDEKAYQDYLDEIAAEQAAQEDDNPPF